MVSDIFEEVLDNEIPKVLKALKRNWPAHFTLHQYITIMLQYKEAKQKASQSLYRCGDIEDGVYLVKTSTLVGKRSIENFFIYTTSEDLTQMLKALKETSRIPWNGSILFEILFSRFIPVIQEAAISKGIRFHEPSKLCMLWLGPDKGLEVGPLPEDVLLKFLDESHVQEINSNWPHRIPGSEVFLAEEIKLNFGIGLFSRSDNKMLSSALHFHSGGIFVLYTDEECRGKGYAEIIVRNMVKEIKLRGRIPYATILSENSASLRLFKKLGFEEFTKTSFMSPAKP